MSYIDRAVMALIARGQSSRLIPTYGKIADITHADINEHSMTLPAGFPENTKAIIIFVDRVSGTGKFGPRSVSGQNKSRWPMGTTTAGFWIRAVDGLFYYALDTANDDWDIYSIAYISG